MIAFPDRIRPDAKALPTERRAGSSGLPAPGEGNPTTDNREGGDPSAGITSDIPEAGDNPQAARGLRLRDRSFQSTKPADLPSKKPC